MKKVAAFLIDKRRILIYLFLALVAVSLFLAGQVRINYDLTKYLPADSHMKQGIQLMEQEFGQAASSELRVMFTNLPEEEKEDVLRWLSGLEHVSSAVWEPTETYNRGDYTLYEIAADVDSHSPEAATLYKAVHEKYDKDGIVTDPFILYDVVFSSQRGFPDCQTLSYECIAYAQETGRQALRISILP